MNHHAYERRKLLAYGGTFGALSLAGLPAAHAQALKINFADIGVGDPGASGGRRGDLDEFRVPLDLVGGPVYEGDPDPQAP